MPITPNINQTMKQTVKASVLTISTESACRLREAAGSMDLLCLSMAVSMHHSLLMDSTVHIRPPDENPSLFGAPRPTGTNSPTVHIVRKQYRGGRGQFVCARSRPRRLRRRWRRWASQGSPAT